MSSWEESVARARQGNRRAIDGRFAVALASFEQFDSYGKGIARVPGVGRRRKATRTMVDFADNVGIAYDTLAQYRAVALWWCEGEPERIGELGVPTYIAWDGLRFAKSHWYIAGELRELLAERTPMNGAMWSREELERLAGAAPGAPRRPPLRQREVVESFDATIGSVRRVGDRLTRTLMTVRNENFDAEQQAAILEHAQRAKAAADFLVSYLEERTPDDFLQPARENRA